MINGSRLAAVIRAALIVGVLAVALVTAGGSGGAVGSVKLVVTDLSGSAIAEVDASSGTVGPAIPVGPAPIDVAVTPDGRTAYVTALVGDAVVPVDLETSTRGAAIPVPRTVRIALVPGRQKAYATHARSLFGGPGTVTPLDIQTNTPGTPIDVGGQAVDVAAAPGGDTVYVRTQGSGTPDALVPIEVETDTPGTPIPLGTSGGDGEVVVTPDGATAFVALEFADAVVPVDLAAGTAGTPIAVSDSPVGLALTPDGTRLFVTHVRSTAPSGLGGEPGDPPHDVTPIDVATRTVLPQIVVGSQTAGVAVSADGTTAYVSLVMDEDRTQGAIVPIDVATSTVGAPITVPGEPWGLAIRPTVNVDTTAPETTITLDPASPNGSNDWYTSSVGVTVGATDTGGSGVEETRCVLDPATPPAAFTDLPDGPCELSSISGDGQHVIYAASKDQADNIESQLVTRSVNIDNTPPTLSPSGLPNPLYLHATGTSASAGASDPTSGSGLNASSVNCEPVDTSTPGNHTLTCGASDNAGNQNSATVQYTVEYKLLGFLSPSKWKAGATVPIKIALADVDGVRIPDTQAAGLLSPTCSVKLAASGTQTLAPTCMKYDPANNQFIFNWKLGNTTGPATITVTVAYQGTTATSTKSAQITIAR